MKELYGVDMEHNNMLEKTRKSSHQRVIVISLIIALCFLLLVGCGKKEVNYDYEFVNINWTRSAENDTEYIHFSNNGSFSYYCACGNPVNDSDLCEGYTYSPDTNTISLICSEKTTDMVSEIKLIECTKETLVLDFNGDIRTFIPEAEEDEYIVPETLSYQGQTYVYLGYKEDIFYYDLNTSTYYEEDIIYSIPNEKWNIAYYNGDLFVLEGEREDARAYYADDVNYTWSVEIDSEDFEDVCSYPLSISEEELMCIYSFEDAEKDDTLSFDSIEIFGTLKKTSVDGFICGSTSLAFYNGSWYWRSEIIDESQEGWPEYVCRLPEKLNNQIISLSEK